MATMEEKSTQPATTHERSSVLSSNDDGPVNEVGLNVSGHKQELQRNFGLLSLCGLGITSGNVWIALGGALVPCLWAGLRTTKRR